uniref:Uncharacterized protein n=1 Tax=Anguilla anguilla TaxID=7936 RepID=A0A0E9WMX9_ANGAN
MFVSLGKASGDTFSVTSAGEKNGLRRIQWVPRSIPTKAIQGFQNNMHNKYIQYGVGESVLMNHSHGRI